MITLLAEASNTFDVPAIVAIITAVVGSGGGYLVGKTKNTHIDNNPLNVKHVEKYVTREEFKELKQDIDEVRRIQRDGEKNAHKRMDVMTEKLGHIDGQLGVIIKLLEK